MLMLVNWNLLRDGQSIGMRFVGIKVVMKNGHDTTKVIASLRLCLSYLIEMLIPFTSLVNIASITCLRFYRFSRVQLSMHLFQWHVSAHAYAVLQHRLPGALPIVNSTDFCFDKQTSRVPDLCKCTYHASITICCHKASTAT